MVTVKQLLEKCQWYINHFEGHENDPVMICDDGMKPEYFNIDFIMSTNFEKRINEKPEYKQVPIMALTTNLLKPEV